MRLCTVWSIFLLGLLGIDSAHGKVSLYPINGIVSPASDDGSSLLISLQQCFIYFGREYCQLYVNQNGHLTFERPWERYIPLKFPMHGPKDIIAPFWTDLDNRKIGNVLYNQYTRGPVLQRATSDINKYFPIYKFVASWVFVATWDKVAYYPNFGDGSTIQVVLISDGQLSFVLMNYETIYPTNHNVQAGYDTVDSTHYFSIPGSFSPNATGLGSIFCLRSNVNVPGRWAFRIDHGSNNPYDLPSSRSVSFWTDSTCTTKCTYTGSGLSCHNESCTFSQVCDSLNDFHFTCQSIQRGICAISGDPHYKMFDEKWHHFQGPCTYVLSQQCGSDLSYYRVEGSSEHRDRPTATWTRLVKVFVYNETIELVKGHRGEAKVNGVFTTTPFFLVSGDVHVYTSGFSVVVSTVFGLEVCYDTNHYVKIKVPYSYQGATCGLCGNFNNDPNDDFQTPEGEIVSAVDFGNSWQVLSADEPECEAGCEGLDCGHCPEDKRALFRNTDHCDILQNTSGPFATCHQVLSPETYVDNCLYDLCLEGGQKHILCQALNVYASECQENGVQLPRWRRPGFCDIPCPANSHFESQSTACPATCVNPESPHDCELPPVESCICNEGFVLSGADCVPIQECGCNFEGRYYHSGQTVILDQDCSRVCDCISGNMTCHSHSCGAHEQCKVLDGVRGCRLKQNFGTCSGSGDPHYLTFDGRRYDFQGTCRYVLATLCNYATGLNNFSVEVKNEALNMVCPTHSHYEVCGYDCGRTCARSIDVTCERVCSEGCFCDEGFVRSGTKCVPEEKCGCEHNGFYYYAGESFWTEGCSQRCECTANNNLSCIVTNCSLQKECSLRDGRLGCYDKIDEPDPCWELECTDNEWCGKKEGNYGCFCNENAFPNSENFDASITCISSSGTVSLSRCLLFEAGFHPSALHLRDDSCKGFLQSGRLVFHFNNDDHNGSHFIYENVILGDDSLNIQLFFSCVFPLTSALSVDVGINPVESAIKKILPSGKGHYRMRLIPYKDAGFQYPLSSSSDIEMRQDERLFIEVQTEDIDERQISAVMETCWATPINEAHYPLHQDLILQGCPADGSVKIIQNGNSTVARFSFETFTFNNYASIYLHCHIHLCLMGVNDCVVHCNVRTRGRRDVYFHNSVMLSLGPLVP